MDVVQTHREIGDKFGGSASATCEKVNTSGIEENLFKLVPVPGHGARVLPRNIHIENARYKCLSLLFIIVTSGASARACDRAPCPGSKSERGVRKQREMEHADWELPSGDIDALDKNMTVLR